MKTCILLGDRSDIAQGLMPFLEADGWTVHGWNRDSAALPMVTWDLVICALGCVAPVGDWFLQQHNEFDECVRSNVLLPIRLLKQLWLHRRIIMTPSGIEGASVCVFAGSNPQKIMAGYLPYNISKMAMLKAVEQIDYESPDCKVFALGPGVTNTKIHKPTFESGIRNERLERAMKDGSFTPIADIYETLTWCINQPKMVCGGRNICVSDLKKYGPELLAKNLLEDETLFKLRRIE